MAAMGLRGEEETISYSKVLTNGSVDLSKSATSLITNREGDSNMRSLPPPCLPPQLFASFT
jgi:hypothetical protein